MRYSVFGVVLCLAIAASAQQPATQPASGAPDTQQLVTKEFGKSFNVAPGFAPLFGDVDGDGQEDAVVVVTSKSPLGDQAAFNYRVIDPYDAYFGWGHTSDTVQFSATNAGPTLYIAVIHNWRAPKAKFLIINLSFKTLELSRVSLKKKSISSIHALDVTGLESDVFWTGKKYKWAPGTMNQ